MIQPINLNIEPTLSGVVIPQYYNTTIGSTNFGNISLSVLVIGGGGGGGNNVGGGGGAGDVVYNSAYLAMFGSPVTVTVGAGGAAQNSGTSSIFGSITAAGGGHGGNTVGTGGSSGNGYSGGSGSGSYAGGGGAGSTSNGVAATNSAAGNGGNGYSSSISGTSVTYAGGGGAGGFSAGGASAGSGVNGGGNGGSGNPSNGTSATTYGSGGGGGSGNSGVGGSGYQGIVIISYTTLAIGDGTGGTITHVGGQTIHTFTTSGTFTAPPGTVTLTLPTTYQSNSTMTFINSGSGFVYQELGLNYFENSGNSTITLIGVISGDIVEVRYNKYLPF